MFSKKKKEEIIELMRKIGAKIDDEKIKEFKLANISGVCAELELLLREKEDKNDDNKKWFFRPYESLPKF